MQNCPLAANYSRPMVCSVTACKDWREDVVNQCLEFGILDDHDERSCPTKKTWRQCSCTIRDRQSRGFKLPSQRRKHNEPVWPSGKASGW